MNKYIQHHMFPSLKKYRWVWLLFFAIMSAVVIIGPSLIGNFIYKTLLYIYQTVCIMVLLILLIKYTLGRSFIGIWRFLRFIGIAGIICFSFFTWIMWEDIKLSSLLWDSEYAERKTNILIFIAFTLSSLFFIALGELLLYLHEITLSKPKATVEPEKEMVCARCLGKGYVDAHDITRLDKQTIWSPGPCLYCNAEGYVPRGKTFIQDPTEEPLEPLMVDFDIDFSGRQPK